MGPHRIVKASSYTGIRRPRNARQLNADITVRNADTVAKDNDAFLDEAAIDDVFTFEA